VTAGPSPPALLELAGVERQRGEGLQAFTLRIESFHLRAGERLAVTGASGSGKSTFLDLLGMVLSPGRAETFRFRERDGTTLDIADAWRSRDMGRLSSVRAREIGYVLQTGGLLPFLNLNQNVALSRRLLGLDDDGFTDELLESLALVALGGKRPRELSIGERQRASIARAFAHRPQLVLADEPTASLDPQQGLRVCELMLSLAERYGIALVIVTHDWGLVERLGLSEARMRPGSNSHHSISHIAYPTNGRADLRTDRPGTHAPGSAGNAENRANL
jgi:putative ABC transport system ATP-binding protein